MLPPDDLDAWLAGAPTRAQRIQFETSEEYREALLEEHRLVELLQALPTVAPRAGFADRVMARVQVPAPAPVRRALPAWATRRTLGIAATLAVSLGGSVWWTAANEALVRGLVGAATSTVTGLWVPAAQAQVAAMAAHPWALRVEQLLGDPARAAAVASALGAAYLGGLLALRRLLAAPQATLAGAGHVAR
ncbi:MAG: hypothetical protein NW201_05285 [Gemmatimonadales bacterium]|nr:hypothetical protein [Gemmatimonadales bacterium]